MNRISKLIGLTAALSLALAACRPPEPTAGPLTLKVAVLPTLDTLAAHVALAQGYFTANGVQVELVPVASAPERDQLLAAGQVDGVMNEILGPILSNQDGVQVQVVRLARTASAEYPLFRLVAGKDSPVRAPSDLAGRTLGISNGTIIEYVADRLLAAEGVDPAGVQYTAVPAIRDRLALLENGQLAAAVLPDPASSSALAAGGRVVLDDTRHPEYGYSVWTFRKATLDQNPAAVRAFLQAVEQAVADLNADGTKWDKVLQDNNLLPPALMGKYTLPRFPTAGVPSESQFNDALDWLKAKGLLAKDVGYADTVNPGLLP
jgi:NitT/TauT family transport system substrate-binding protein